MPAKKTSPSKKQSLQEQPLQELPKRSKLKWCLITLLKLSVVVIVTLAIYAIYLDSKVQQTFEGQRWQVPVQVYGKTPVLSLGAPLDLLALKETLLLSHYQKVSQVTQAGQFAMSAERVIIYRPYFDFGYDILAEQKITIDLKNGLINQIALATETVGEVRLAPVLIDRILPESKEDRVLIGLEEVPEQLIDMLLLVEDRDFYFHHGVSPLGIARALVANIKAGRTVQGGSTLTQQLVKNMFLTRHKTIWRKLNEAMMALILEYRYSKDQLLEAYLNEVYLGQHYANGIYGFGLAAEFYFGKNISQLSLAQMAILVGQIKGPSFYDPWRYPKRALKRRDLILSLMIDHQYIDKSQYQLAVNAPLSIRKTRRIAKQKQPAYLQLVKRELSEILSEQAQQSGVKVFTGFDVRRQQQVNKTIESKISALEKASKQTEIEVAMLVSDHHTGEILAVAGGRDVEYAGFNRAINANRPIGSLIKPFVYVAALERGEKYNLASILADEPLAITADNGEVWRPKNYDKKFRGTTTLYQALVSSYNIPTVNLGLELGLPTIAELLKTLGYQPAVYMQPALLLGAINMSPYEVNQLYLTLAAKGAKKTSHVINHIVAENGQTLWRYQAQEQQILSAQASYLLNYALHGVTHEGSAKSLSWRLPNAVVAGKTGTSNDQRDSWFIGYDDEVLVTTWVGRDDNKKTAFTGSSGALILFTDFMKNHGVSDLSLAPVDGIEEVWFNDESGLAYLSRCAQSTTYPVNIYTLAKRSACEEKHEADKSWFDRWFGD
ncbi:MAG: penicillin-binding protein 1B [Thalassotalea sp.]